MMDFILFVRNIKRHKQPPFPFLLTEGDFSLHKGFPGRPEGPSRVLAALFNELRKLLRFPSNVLEHVVGLTFDSHDPESNNEYEDKLLSILMDFPYKVRGHCLPFAMSDTEFARIAQKARSVADNPIDWGFVDCISFPMPECEQRRRLCSLLIQLSLFYCFGSTLQSFPESEPHIIADAEYSSSPPDSHVPQILPSLFLSPYTTMVESVSDLFPPIPSCLMGWEESRVEEGVQIVCQPSSACLDNLYYLYSRGHLRMEYVFLLANAMTAWQLQRLVELLKWGITGQRPPLEKDILAAAHTMILWWPLEANEITWNAPYEVLVYGGSSRSEDGETPDWKVLLPSQSSSSDREQSDDSESSFQSSSDYSRRRYGTADRRRLSRREDRLGNRISRRSEYSRRSTTPSAESDDSLERPTENEVWHAAERATLDLDYTQFKRFLNGLHLPAKLKEILLECGKEQGWAVREFQHKQISCSEFEGVLASWGIPGELAQRLFCKVSKNVRKRITRPQQNYI
eukprot:Protomagalhaensia_sp_Gyna_25__5285@NODE_656_length_2901_cov_6_734102_g512_i0_p1_GENE_NODE_656_length_2901_cov_6_734102_g512_i0NODE_656_length_2901_cov_6_734102_g512_i0_p1_ORF_typecomplete_len513_score35_23_NODE_656_length_2901_cov_6_734102_g512_i0671605